MVTGTVTYSTTLEEFIARRNNSVARRGILVGKTHVVVDLSWLLCSNGAYVCSVVTHCASYCSNFQTYTLQKPVLTSMMLK